MDGAHTRESAEALAGALKRHFKFDRLHLILAMMQDKDPHAFVGPLVPLLDRIWVTSAKNRRSFSPHELAKKIEASKIPIEGGSSFREVFLKAQAECGKNDLILITGSLYLVGEAEEYFEYETK